MSLSQPGILEPLPPLARYLTLELLPEVDPRKSMKRLAAALAGTSHVVGIGPSLAARLGARIEGLRPLAPKAGPGFDVPSTPAALWIWLRGADRGVLVHTSRDLESVLEEAFALSDVTDGFTYREGRDLTGYVDGTENPTGDKAVAAAFIDGGGPGLDGGSFVAVQKWVHDLDAFDEHSQKEQDEMMGRRKSDNEELGDAPPSAHVKRTAQESFEPDAFVVRRSMPWADDAGEGLVFVSFGCRLDMFEAQLARMVGEDDGVVDALFRFTRPVTGATFFCPPQKDGRLDLSAFGL